MRICNEKKKDFNEQTKFVKILFVSAHIKRHVASNYKNDGNFPETIAHNGFIDTIILFL